METFLYDLLHCYLLAKCCKSQGQEKNKYIWSFLSVQFQQLTLKTSGNKALTGVNIAVVYKHLLDENDEDDHEK